MSGAPRAPEPTRADPALADALDLAAHPLDRPDRPGWSELVSRCRDELSRVGRCSLPGLLAGAAVDRELALLDPRWGGAHAQHREHNVWFVDPEDLPADVRGHPAAATVTTSNRTLCADELAGSVLPGLQRWPPLHRFLAAVTGVAAVHPSEDPLGSVNVMRADDGDGLGWHFDRAASTVTVLLRAPRSGGRARWRTGLRRGVGPGGPVPAGCDLDGVAAVLAGRDPLVRTGDATPGTLEVFSGATVLHGAEPVRGGGPRVVAVLAFAERPGARLPARERLGFYGRDGAREPEPGAAAS